VVKIQSLIQQQLHNEETLQKHPQRSK